MFVNPNSLVGNGDIRGFGYGGRVKAANVYPGAIPTDKLREFLDTARVIETDLTYDFNGESIVDPSRKAIVHAGNGSLFNTPRRGYKIHQHSDWGMGLANSLELDCIQATLDKGGARVYLTFTIGESFNTPEGVEFFQNLLYGSDHGGTLASTHMDFAGLLICDNQWRSGTEAANVMVKTKRTKNSSLSVHNGKVGDILMAADKTKAEIARLCEWEVTGKGWSDFLTAYVPDPADGNARGMTVADNKKGELNELYRFNEMVAPWAGTAFGVMQAVNTYDRHRIGIRQGIDTDAERAIAREVRSFSNTLSGELDSLMGNAYAILERVAA